MFALAELQLWLQAEACSRMALQMRGTGPPSFTCFGGELQHDASGAAWGRERENEDRGKMRTEDCSHSLRSRGEQAALGRSE